MASSEVEICNSALIKLGAETIVTLEDDNKRARLCKAQYPVLRDEVLRAHPWNFAVARKALALSSVAPEFEYDNQFIIPNDVLRIIYTDANSVNRTVGEIEWSVETDSSGNRVLLTNEGSMEIKYIKKVTDVGLFDTNFSEVLAWRIAADLAYPIVQSTTLTQLMFQNFNEALRQARSMNAQEGSIPVVEANEFLDSRF